ncbi:MAG TPA: helicase HerA-like domain-containing protein [Geminicoccaceae bacterium]|nr:helicase HerA-like domain-containing protein [Geminicoccaceae bacterium]
MGSNDAVLVGKGATPQWLALGLANRHGLITGATGTGKTVTLQTLAEGFSAAGVPVFMADVKGDLSGISQAAAITPKLRERAQAMGLADYAPRACPTVFWDLFGEQGHPIRTTVSEMGPLLLARLLGLNETQEGVLQVAFRVADDQGLLLLDLKDLRALMHFVGERPEELSLQYGRVGTASVGAIQRRLLTLEQQGAEHFFGEPALDIHDLMRTDRSGQGIVNVLAADQLMQAPKLYATFLLWLLSELFEALPEVGDPDKPKLVFFFDEAHLLFEDAPKVLLDKVEQVVRLIRSKGVGVYFISQSPLDVPDDVLGQLGNKVQHALRAFTPRDQKAIRAVAETFRANPALDTGTVITELAVGEALVSMLQDQGVPGMVERILIRPPASRIGPASAEERRAAIGQSPVAGRYDQVVDRESAYEVLKAKAAQPATPPPPPPTPADVAPRPAQASGRQRQTVVEAMAISLARSLGTQIANQIGRQIVRGVLGSVLRR